MIGLYAQPYNIHAQGFFFSDLEGYEERAAGCTDAFGLPVEEFEIQFIDGDAVDAGLFRAMDVHQVNIGDFLEAVEGLDRHEKLALIAMGECGYLINSGTDTCDVDIYHCDSMLELARQFVDEGLYGPIPDSISNYVDYDAIARDLGLDYTEMEVGGQTFIYRCP